MQVILSSKQVELTQGLKTFVLTRLTKLSKISLRSLSHIQVILDVNRKKRGVTQDAVIEMIGELHGKHIAVKANGQNFYAAFFAALAKMKGRLQKEKQKNVVT